MQPKVSLIIPCFNSEKFLSSTLKSVCNQTLDDFECIVVNDASTDRSREIIKGFCQKNNRIKYVEHRANAHVSAARNTGIRSATGRYIAFLDSDDLITPERLESGWRTCEAARKISDKYAGSYSASMEISEDDLDAGKAEHVRLPDIGFVSVGGKCPFNANQPMIRTEIIRMFGGFSESLSQAEDYNLWLMILRAGYWFAPAKLRTVTYRRRRESLVRKAPLSHLSNSMCLLKHSDSALPDNHLSASAYRLVNDFSVYEKQLRRAHRVLEFCGMTLVLEDGSDERALALACAEIPDATDIFPTVDFISSHVISGMKRAKGSIEKHDEANAAAFVSALIELTRKESRASSSNINSYSPFGMDSPCQNRIWDDSIKTATDVFFFPHKDYHVWTISLIAEGLEKMGVSFQTVDITSQWRDAGVRAEAKKQGLNLLGLGEFILSQYSPKLIVVFNDWDHVTRPIVVAAKNSGIPTLSIVEGIQDYDDADTGRRRDAYKATDIVLLPGEFDKKYFSTTAQKIISVGVPRIESLRRKPYTVSDSTRIKVLINSNFSYGVQEEHRDSWVRAAISACLNCGYEPILSRHPADNGKEGKEYQTSLSFYEALEQCNITVQRFASGILEALARGRGVVYFNPHGEKVDKFTSDTMGSFPIAVSTEALKKELIDWRTWQTAAQSMGKKFLDFHSGKISEDVSENLSMHIFEASRNSPSEECLKRFFQNLRAIDLETSSFCHAVKNGSQLFDSLVKADRKMDKMREDLYSDDVYFQSFTKNLPNLSEQVWSNPQIVGSKFPEKDASISPDSKLHKSLEDFSIIRLTANLLVRKDVACITPLRSLIQQRGSSDSLSDHATAVINLVSTASPAPKGAVHT